MSTDKDVKSDVKQRWQEELAELRRLRDELRVQAHLGALDAKETWETLEAKWPSIEARLHELEHESQVAFEHVGKAMSGLLAELRRGYDSLRRP